MVSRLFAGVGVAVLLGLSLAPAFSQGEDMAARIEPIVIESSSGTHLMNVEIADTPALRERGLMFRQRIPDDHGMLFLFDTQEQIAMWMKNTLVGLDMVFIRADGTVSQVVANTKPLSLEIIQSKESLPAVLELGAGSASRLGIGPGALIRYRYFGNLG